MSEQLDTDVLDRLIAATDFVQESLTNDMLAFTEGRLGLPELIGSIAGAAHGLAQTMGLLVREIKEKEQ